uniref:Odorant receptor n=1 Tax=Lutzomyia longipalpis TaxID=7200 RepID=A0A240SXR1_LUTLO
MTSYLEEFVKVKPLMDYLIALSTLEVISGSTKNRLKILFLTISLVFYWYSICIHVKNSIGLQININFMWTFLLWIMFNDYVVIMILNVFKKNKFHQLMQNIQKMFEEEEEDEELADISKNNLNFSMKVFFFVNRWEKRLACSVVIIGSTYFRFNQDYGLIMDFPYIHSNNVLWRESQYILQSIYFGLMTYTILTVNMGIIFLGLQVIAQLNILNDYIKVTNEKIKTDPNFFRKIIIRHCSVIENVNLLSEIISKTSFLQLFASCVVFLFGFSFIMKSFSTFVNYSMLLAGVMLSLHICIIGEFIRYKTDELSETLYLTNWHELTLKDKKTFLIILGMAQREYGLKAAGMYDVNLYTFVQIIKIAFSYCAVLYSLSK